MHQSVNKTEYFLDSLITLESLKLVDNISNQLNHQYYLIILLFMWGMRRTYILELKISLNIKINDVFK